ncbi:26S protease regulatory subunit 7 [Zostera marina]|uniref:26S protease regulatory subunit 7 n=1 Tax=Zostera marina TaxID=29655 RepID=A0A0K9NTH0_ZOSMR|nr:26S protease regulatory subunit 7 [Zostera marina]
MDSKENGGVGISAVRSSDRIRNRFIRNSYMYYPTPARKNNNNAKKREASKIVKLLQPKKKHNAAAPSNLVVTDLRRSTRKRRAVNMEDYETDSSRTNGIIDLIQSRYHSPRSRINHRRNQNEISDPEKHKKISITKSIPRREGLRPRRSVIGLKIQAQVESEYCQNTSEVPDDQDTSENFNDIEVDNQEDVESEDDDEVMEEEEEEEDDTDADDDEVEKEGEEDEFGEGDEHGDKQGGRTYHLRNRTDVRRSCNVKEGKQILQSPHRALHEGANSKNNKKIKWNVRLHKRHHLARNGDSDDDSLLVDELDQGPPIPWTQNGNRNDTNFLFGGIDVLGTSPWGLNASASGWGYQGDATTSSVDIQTAGPSFKGGADIQPLQIDDSVSFDEIGGLSEYVDALKEMVFFPLLYPDFFTNYQITPPRGVLLCGPPGTGKTLIARALAYAASKAGQKVSFYMRKGADILSKWVGEAERQLKLLFEEAQRTQPSIIFFDEIDGLAPVRSSKQEQIHNSIVSTLLALMDGLDPRGQIVLIGATNRIDAIDGALRRPGRFDREFFFTLPGCKARAEILEIHTRKWKQPPLKELKMKLAASCVGYCGADLKALCTEAAILAFREKYPQVYTSDDKFCIDVDSIRIEKCHFIEAMSTITPAAHRGSVVLSRPLSFIVAPCLQRHFRQIMEKISDIFPSFSSMDISKLSGFSYGSTIPLVYRPRLLICGDESAGLDHIGPAILHELEKFPVHSLGLASLFSDPSAKTSEEALVHIFCEARRTTPSILYLPQFHIWWDTAHEQLKAVLLSLLDELPSNFPIFLLGTSSVAFADFEGDMFSVFSFHNVYQVDKPTTDDRSMFVDLLVEAVLSIPLEEISKSKVQSSLDELQKLPKEPCGPKASEVRAKAEAEQHALRRLRMCFRDICNRILHDKRFNVFHYPVMNEDAPDYHSIVQNPMDMATLLQRVDSGQYLTYTAFLQDVDLIMINAKAYNDDDYFGSRIVSRAYELRDVVQGMLSQIDPSLISFCDKIAAQGGPIPLPNDTRLFSFPPAPVVQQVPAIGTGTQRNVQPEANFSQSYESLKISKKSCDPDQNQAGTDSGQNNNLDAEKHDSLNHASFHPQQTSQPQPPHESNSKCLSKEHENNPVNESISDNCNNISDMISCVKQHLNDRTIEYGVPQLERLYTRVLKGVITNKSSNDSSSNSIRDGADDVEDKKNSILKFLSMFANDISNF